MGGYFGTGIYRIAVMRRHVELGRAFSDLPGLLVAGAGDPVVRPLLLSRRYPPAAVALFGVKGNCQGRPRDRRSGIDRVGQGKTMLRPRASRRRRHIPEAQLVVGSAACSFAGIQCGLGFVCPDNANTLGRTAL
ncbi:MAG TPA: hypothetical protein VFV02_02045 [Acidimicrobiales bacterium]|nr:hypothetical protein [Acidimicrobiales bacterium]